MKPSVSKEYAQRIANERNKKAGKKIWIAMPSDEGDGWQVISLNELIREELK